MHPETRNIAEHMKNFGLHILGRAICDSTSSEMLKPYAHALSIVHAAHGAEIVLKARIAQEHPLLIFERLPNSASTSTSLTVTELLNSGRSIHYEELPEMLWAATGYRFSSCEKFLQFGRLRNQIMHCAVPEGKLSDVTLRFCFEVVEPLVWDFWQESLVPYSAEWDDEIVLDGYLAEQLDRIGIAHSLKTVG